MFNAKSEPVITSSTSIGINALVRIRRKKSCSWLITDQRLDNEDVLIKLAKTVHPKVAAIIDVDVVLSFFAVSEANAVVGSLLAVESGGFQLPLMRLKPEFHVSQVVLLVLMHFCQFKTKQLETVNFTSF